MHVSNRYHISDTHTNATLKAALSLPGPNTAIPIERGNGNGRGMNG